MPRELRYRRDIDGLRGIAVLAVVFYHATVSPSYHGHGSVFAGGYVGVDIFFVISGFLITSILLDDARNGRLRLSHFYDRRIRRIFPALFAVIGTSFGAAWFLFFPDQLESLGKSAIAAVLFVSNFFFRAQTENYFAPTTALSPLLHTWSLAVEEQFYIVFPALLYLTFRFFRKHVTAVIIAGIVVSFAIAQWAMGEHPKGAFYLAPARAWEFLLGTLLALETIPTLKSRSPREIIAVVGAFLILWPIFTFTPDTPFPGANALFPCLGATFIIYVGTTGPTLVTRALQFRPLVWIGLISYSLYLWHWPFLVFFRQYFGTLNLGAEITTSIVLISLCVSALSWRFIEQPFRRPQRLQRKTVFFLGASAASAAIIVAVFVVLRAGLPNRIPKYIAQIANDAKDYDPRRSNCLELSDTRIKNRQICKFGASKTDTPSFALWGDSHAGALMPAVEDSAKRYGLTGDFVGRSACPPLLGIIIAERKDGVDCRDFNNLVIEYLRKTPSINTVLIAGRWAAYAEWERYKESRWGHVLIEDDQSSSLTPAENHRVFSRALGSVLIKRVPQGRLS